MPRERAKPSLEAACFRLQNHKKGCILQALFRAVFFQNQRLIGLWSPAWGARGRVFESLRPDHIFQ
jgi:hypothetical protein